MHLQHATIQCVCMYVVVSSVSEMVCMCVCMYVESEKNLSLVYPTRDTRNVFAARQVGVIFSIYSEWLEEGLLHPNPPRPSSKHNILWYTFINVFAGTR